MQPVNAGVPLCLGVIHIPKMFLNGNTFEVTFNEDDTVTAKCERDKNGFRIVLVFTNYLEEHDDAMSAIGRFYAKLKVYDYSINTLLEEI